jgi:DNA-binding helix-hairpin-helix protein with protein kinase domain
MTALDGGVNTPSLQEGRLLRDAADRPLQLGKEIGRGGEGRIYQTVSPAHAGLVAKVWDPGLDRDPSVLAQLQTLTRRGWPDPTGHPRVATLHGIFSDAAAAPAGVLLAALPQEALELAEVLTNADRHLAGFSVSLRWQMRMLARLSDVVARAHAERWVIGDLGPRNFAVLPDSGRVTAFDIDAWQPLRDAAPRRIAEDVLSPEAAASGDYRPTMEGDRWSLGITIALVLLNGRHPFDGVPLGESEGQVRANVIAGHNVLLGGGLRPTPDAPSIRQFAPRTRTLFEQLLERGAAPFKERPTALAWTAALRDDERELTRCRTADESGLKDHLSHPAAECGICALHDAHQGAGQ